MTNRSKPSEIELVEGLKAHSQKAFSRLYDDYGPTLLGVICKIVRDGDEAENLLQDTFIKVWKHIDSYDSNKGRLFTWLLNIARNTAINFLRASRQTEHTDIQSFTNSVRMGEELTVEPLNISHIGVGETVSRLDPKLRLIIDLLYFEGFTQQEVADHLKLPLGTVKTRTRTALQQLKTLY